MELILASNSPRRKEILQSKGVKFKVVVSDYKEEQFSTDPVSTALEFAFGKANAVFQSLSSKDDVVVLGADTVVFYNGEILGKAKSKEHAKQMLETLSGKTHKVVTGYSLISKDKMVKGYSESSVKFNILTKELVLEYLDSGLYVGKAGGYGIQDGYPLVESYAGDYNNIVGLPVDEIMMKLKELI